MADHSRCPREEPEGTIEHEGRSTVISDLDVHQDIFDEALSKCASIKFRGCRFVSQILARSEAGCDVDFYDCVFDSSFSIRGHWGSVSFSHCFFERQVDTSGTMLDGDLVLQGCTFKREVSISGSAGESTSTYIGRGLTISDSRFEDVLDLQRVTVEEALSVEKSSFGGDVLMNGVVRDDVVQTSRLGRFVMESSVCSGGFLMQGAVIEGCISIYFSRFEGNFMMARRVDPPVKYLSCTAGGMDLRETVFSRDLSFYGGTLSGDLNMDNVDICGDFMLSRYDDRDWCRGFVPSKLAGLLMDQCKVGGRTYLSGCTFSDDVVMRGCRFEREFYFHENDEASGFPRLEGGLEVRDCVFASILRSEGLEVLGSVAMMNDVFEKPISFSRLLEGDTVLIPSRFHGPFTMESCRIGDLMSIMGTEFGSDARFVFSTFANNVRFSCTLRLEVPRFVGSVFHGQAVFRESKFEQDLSMYQCRFEGLADFGNVLITKDLVMSRRNQKADCPSCTEFLSDAVFADLQVGGLSEFEGCHFHGPADFSRCIFERECRFSALNHDMSGDVTVHCCTFDGEVCFDHSEFKGDALFSAVGFNSMANFVSVTFERSADFGSESGCGYGSTFSGVDFSRTYFHGHCWMRDCIIGGSVTFDMVVFDDDVVIVPAAGDEKADVMCFRGVTFSKTATVRVDRGCTLDMTNAFLNGVVRADVGAGGCDLVLTDSEVIGSLFVTATGSNIRMGGCTVTGTVDVSSDFETIDLSRSMISGQLYVDWDYISSGGHLVSDGSDVYRMLKENYARIGRYDDEDRAYIEFRLREAGDGLTATSRLWGYAYRFFGRIGGLGTRIASIIMTMVLMVLAFAVIYAFLPGADLTLEGGGTASMWDNLYYSMVTFLTLEPGDLSPANELTQLITVAEGFLGIFMIFYLTMAFARKILR